MPETNEMKARRAVLNLALGFLDEGDEDGAAHAASLLQPQLDLTDCFNIVSAIHIARAVRDRLEAHGASEHVLDAQDQRLDEAEALLLPPTSGKLRHSDDGLDILNAARPWSVA